MKWVTVILGVVLVLVPFVFGYNANSTALWTSVILGVVVAVLGYMKQHVLAAIAGVIIFVAPWILGFSGLSSALWSCLLVGGAVALLNGYEAIVERKEAEAGNRSGSAQQHRT